MRIRTNPERERIYGALLDATGENTKAKAIDRAARYYCRMRGGNELSHTGAIARLLDRAERQGSVSVEEIAEILNDPDLAVEGEEVVRWSVGEADE